MGMGLPEGDGRPGGSGIVDPGSRPICFFIMSAIRIESVEVAEDGLVVRYDDASCAFYHESIFRAHLAGVEGKKKVGRVAVEEERFSVGGG